MKIRIYEFHDTKLMLTRYSIVTNGIAPEYR